MVTITKQDYTKNKKIYNDIEEDLRKQAQPLPPECVSWLLSSKINNLQSL